MIFKVNDGQTISTKQLYTRLGIGKSTFFSNKKDILLDLADAYEYEVAYEGRDVYYHFIKKNHDYEYNRKNSKKAKERDEIFEKAIIFALQEQPLNTAMNVKRIILQEWDDVKKLNYSEGTVYQYVRVRMRKWFGVNEGDLGSFKNVEDMKQRKGYIKRKVWCYLDNSSYESHNIYRPLSREQIDYLMQCFKKYRKDARVVQLEAGINGDCQAGLITKEERNRAIGEISGISFGLAKKDFKQKYSHYPIRVPEYVLYEE